MKKSILFIALPLAFVASCSTNKNSQMSGKIESDEVYFQPNDTYISDFALVDDEVKMGDSKQAADTTSNKAKSSVEDDYYDGNPTTNNGTINNYYGCANQNPWGNNCNNNGFGNNGYCGYNNNCGFGNYGYGSFSSWNSPRFSLAWSPWSGWYSCFNFGYNWGGYQWYSPYNNYNYSWYSPFYNPWYYNQFGFNSCFSPYNYYNSYYGYNNLYNSGYLNGYNSAIGDVYANVVFGHRNPIATGTVVNSTYGDNIFYSGKESDEVINNQVSFASGSQQIAPTTLSASQSSIENASVLKPVQDINSGEVIQQSSASNHAATPENGAVKPNQSNSNQTGLFIPQSVASEKPRPTYTSDDIRQSVNDSNLSKNSSNSGANQHGKYQETKYESTSRGPWQQTESGINRNPAQEYKNPTQYEQPRNNQPTRQDQGTTNTRPAAQPDKGSQGGRLSPQTSGGNKGVSAPSGGSRNSGGGGNNSGGSISGPRRK